jgi:predicted nucleic acid-binding protein
LGCLIAGWESVITRAEKLALDHTPRHGARAMDIMHVAFALQLGATELLSFDANQRLVAQAEGLVVAP